MALKIIPAALTIAVVAISSAFSCQNGQAPRSTGPGAAEVLAKMDRADFYVLFDADTKSGAGGEQLSWIKVRSTSRWDLVSSWDALVGDAILKDGSTGAGWTCFWSIAARSRQATSTCDDHAWTDAIEGALIDKIVQEVHSLPGDALPVGQRDILGVEAFCYQTRRPAPSSGQICLSSEGVPLAVDARYELGAGLEIHAVATSVEPTPTDDVWSRPVSSGDQRDVPTTALLLPSVPLVSKWMSK
jgi:hypothetical protein